ncbi:MAG: hypothetical protein JWN16_1559 [Alphaproteobacteria bacterium]|nr:hypothetical protein [Alphaproteobacteria bacterium]
MTNITVLNSQDHRTLRVQPGASPRYGDDKRFVAVIVGEFPFVAVHYPILLTKDAQTGGFLVGAMLGFDEDENLFLDEKGMESYRPLNLQRGPFFTAGSDLAIDVDHPRIGGGELLFTEAGEPAPYLRRMMSLFRDLVPGSDTTRAFIEIIIRLKLVEPIDITASFDDGGKRTLTDLYTINQEALRALPDAAAIDLFRKGYLQLIYLMIGSLKQIPVLAQKKNRRLLAATASLGA